ncbi:CpsD/CapB family tyrosine-protein kinase [Pokkaliibacter sp. MBI-7]|uniref:CpsD/CapB family tyrosine-protein kinase n=1 Tax=Pokkaliibacter sp. MBI-7 TaxID=3040600 RepID=UPI002448CB95|nr:CpsD/CapB family tyrosine-protein kinase [Pokkaliibacter sp. MBI-7]MDH2432979.1 CpsD/CapB family tyrosine-protein kinase [Pokkaliibacter sp. MBI-7]
MNGNSRMLQHLAKAPSEINLVSTMLDPAQQVFLLTSAGSQSGTTTSAVTLANQLAKASMGQVLLIDASLSATSITQQSDLRRVPGLLELLENQTSEQLAASVLSFPDLPFHLLPLGQRTAQSEQLIQEKTSQLLSLLKRHFRFIVIDADAVYASADTLIFSSLVDGVILVIGAEETRWEVAQAATHRLTQNGAHILGTVFNRRKYYMPKWLYDQL